MIYVKNYNVRLTKTQSETLDKLKDKNIKVSNFIREAIKEKIQKEYEYIMYKPKKSDYPF